MRKVRALALTASAIAALTAPIQATAGLECVRPWGADELAGARMAVAGDVGGGSYDGFLVGLVTAVEGDRHVTGEFIDLDVAVAIDTDAVDQMRLGVSANGPALRFEPGTLYFLTLEDERDAGIDEMYVHPCGPALPVSGGQVTALLAEADGFVVVSPDLLADIQAEKAPTLSLTVPIAVAVVAILAGAAAFTLPRQTWARERRRR